MVKPHILQLGPYPEWDETPLKAAFQVHRLFDASEPQVMLEEIGPSIRGIATRGELGADRKIIEACPNLEIVSVYGVGYDAVDLDLCRQRGICVTNTPDVLTNDVADFGIAMMLGLSRNLVVGDNWVRGGRWLRDGNLSLGNRVWGKRAGIIGLGRIGFQVGRRLAAFDMEVAYSDLSEKDYALNWTFIADPAELARRSDVLFVTLAASSATKHIIGPEVIESMGPQGTIINISRASNIDEDALISALANGRLGAAALDVFENEPKIDPRFLDLPNVMVQPHQASGTIETRKAMGQLMRENLTAHFSGRELVTPVA
ncbi:MAG: 2-hydroxyacid dehydrogenase [Hyphomicrobiaceae bacterium]|nr:2-hydroxyacid dehydrogenase [Hyphomicrobiaceae bacterium]